ncbi:MAG: PilZ domain-containing protein [Nitrospirota bacterium]
MKSRTHERVDTYLYSIFSFNGKFYRGNVAKLSEKDIFIRVRTDIPLDSCFELLILEDETLLEIPVKVVWLIKGDGLYDLMCVEVLNPQKDYLEFVYSLISISMPIKSLNPEKKRDD